MVEYPSNKEGHVSASPHAKMQRGQYSTFLREILCEYADAGSSAYFYVRSSGRPCNWRCFTIAKLDHQLNEEIRDKEIRLIGADGAQLGIMSADEANNMAEEQGLDLVKISPNAVPPVCKIMDYSKFCFDQKKKEKEAKKNQKVVEIKEIRMSPSIDTNDFNTKLKNAQKFLKDGNRVKVSVRFRGREMAHTNIGEKLLLDFAEACAEIATTEKNPKLEGRFMAMFLSPKASK